MLLPRSDTPNNLIRLIPNNHNEPAELTREDAEALVFSINHHLNEARRLLKQFYDGRGWVAYGYATFRECAVPLFGKSVSTLYRQINAGSADLMLEEITGQPQKPLSVRAANSANLHDLTPGDQMRALKYAAELAHLTSESGSPNSHQIERGVQIVRAEQVVEASPYKVVAYLWADKTWNAEHSAEMVTLLDAASPASQLELQKLLAEDGLCDWYVAKSLLGKMEDERRTGSLSIVLDEVRRTKCIGSVPLAAATLHDLKRANEEASAEHRSDAIQPDPGTKTVSVFLYPGDTAKTIYALKRALSEDAYATLRQAMCEEE